MRTDFSPFCQRLTEARRARDKSEAKICQQIGFSGRRDITLALTGPDGIDLWRLSQIADVLDVSLDWLTGRSKIMDVMETPEPPKPKSSKKKE
jgi:hypothetical protein